MTSLGLQFSFQLLALLSSLWLHSEVGYFHVLAPCSSALDLQSNSLNNHSRGKLYFPYSYSQCPVQAYLKLKLIVTERRDDMEYVLAHTSMPAVAQGLGVEEALLGVLALKVELGECIPDRQIRTICSRQSTPWLLNIMHTLVPTFNRM